jgi:chitodextrinase
MTAFIGLCAVALALLGVNAVGQAAGVNAPGVKAVAQATQASTVPAWTGTFDNFHTAPWAANWGPTSDTAQCQGVAGAFTCNWGYGNLQPVTDSTAPGSGQALKVTYPAKSGPPSCFLGGSGCVLGGGQFYQDLTTNGQSALAQSPSLDLKYAYSFPVGFDFGGKTQGKMPGLWGGGVPGCESGAQHCANGWSTRYMWKGGSSTAPNGELYFYTASGSGFGADLCNGNWHFAADGKWHSIEQLVNVQTGSITIWSDGANVCQVTEPLPGANSGVFFSTFHGGHDTSYSPSKTTTDEFANFTLSTDGPQSTGPTAPAAPAALTASGTSSSTIGLSWTEGNNGDAATSYKVYEGSNVVGTATGTSATISGLTAGSTHTYTVTALDAAGKESGHSASATATTPSSTTSPATPTGLAVTGTTSSSIGLGWTETNNADPAASYTVLEGGTVVGTSTGTSATIGGLTPGSTHTYTVAAVDAAGNASAPSTSVTATTPNPTTTPAVPSHLVVASATASSISLNWLETNNADPAASYKVYEGTAVVGTSTTTSATISGLSAGSTHTYTVTAVDGAGNESARSASATGSTSGGGGGGLTVSIAKTKDWGSGYTDTGTVTNTSAAAVTGWNVQFDFDASENIESSSGVSYASSANHFTLSNVSTDATIAAGAKATFVFSGDYGSKYIAPTNVAAYALGAPQSPATPTGLAVTGTTGSSISLAWTETNNSDPATSYKISEGGVVVATSSTTSATISGLTPGSIHTYTVTAVDAAGNGSAASAPVTGTTGIPTTTPAPPTGLAVTSTTNSSISLAWTETNNADPAASYKVYEGTTVVGTSTTTGATISGLTAGSTHTYTVTALDASNAESAHSTSATGTTTNPTTTPAPPTGLAVTGTTTTSISLAWTETNNADPAASYKVYEGGTVVATPTTTSATISGLASGTSHTYTVTALDAAAVESAHSASITGTTQSSGGGSPFTQALIDSAVAAPPFAWAAPTSGTPRPGTNPANINESKVVYYLALVDRQAPGSKATSGTSVDSALLAQVRSLIGGGHEPDADGGLEMWGQAPIAQALLLLKNGPGWASLTSAEQNKVTLLEAAMGYGSNYTYNDANSFPSGICGFGNFSKTNNPNYRDGGVDTEIAVIQYFGASTWDSMLTSFNDASVASQLNAAGLTNAGGCFTTVGSGGNSAIAIPFVYQGHHSSDLMGIWSTIAGNTFDKTAQSTVSPAHIADNTTSPYDGKCCMGHEFSSTDSQGLRSSALYTFEGWMNVTGSRVSMEVLGNFNPGAAPAESAYHIGTLDLKYKLDHGYISHALNQSDILVDDHGNPATDGPNAKGFLYDWDGYTVSGAPAS